MYHGLTVPFECGNPCTFHFSFIGLLTSVLELTSIGSDKSTCYLVVVVQRVVLLILVQWIGFAI